MNSIKLIKSEADYEKAMARVMDLMDADFEEGSEEENELEVLALIIEQYEESEYPIDPPDPIDAIKFRMDQMGLINKDLVPYIGSASKVSEVLSGKRPLSLNMIKKLSKGLGISADTLIKEPEKEKLNETDIDWLSFPLAEIKKRGYLNKFSGSLSELKEYAAEYVGEFLSSVPGGLQLKPTLLRTSAHHRANDKTLDSYALWIWQARVLQIAEKENLPTYITGTVDWDWMSKLAKCSWSEKGPILAKEYLNKSGIHLIFEPHFSKTYLDGAVCISSTGNPIVALTLRHDKLDNFWFTLMHELAHISLHIENGPIWYLDDLDSGSSDDIEREADLLARDALIPSNEWDINKISSFQDVLSLAQSLSISPCIVAGRVRYESKNHSAFGTKFRDKVTPLIN